MITVDYKAFLRHRFWFGRYYWTVCSKHRYAKSDCEMCDAGGVWFNLTIEANRPNRWYDYPKVYKMDMNSVRWKDD